MAERGDSFFAARNSTPSLRRGRGGAKNRTGCAFFAIPLREDLSTVVDDKRPPPTEDETHKPAHAEPASAKAQFDALIKQLRTAPGQPELRDRAKAVRGWST